MIKPTGIGAWRVLRDTRIVAYDLDTGEFLGYQMDGFSEFSPTQFRKEVEEDTRLEGPLVRNFVSGMNWRTWESGFKVRLDVERFSESCANPFYSSTAHTSGIEVIASFAIQEGTNGKYEATEIQEAA